MEELTAVQRERDLYQRQLEKVDQAVGFPDGDGHGRIELIETLRAECAALRQERDDEQKARLEEVEHWVQRYNDGESWRVATLQRAIKAEARLTQLVTGLREYGAHKEECDLSQHGFVVGMECTCGLADLLAVAEKEEGR